jgi:hypothetical protein
MKLLEYSAKVSHGITTMTNDYWMYFYILARMPRTPTTTSTPTNGSASQSHANRLWVVGESDQSRSCPIRAGRGHQKELVQETWEVCANLRAGATVGGHRAVDVIDAQSGGDRAPTFVDRHPHP